MKNYEAMYIFKVMEDESKDALITKFNKVIEENSGNVEKVTFWGKKRLAYEINDMSEGLYILVNFEGTAQTTKELDRVLKLSEEVLRHMIVRVGE